MTVKELGVLTVLVIGASGLLGRRLCESLVRRSIPVIATCRRLPAAVDIPGVKWRQLRLSSFNGWDRLLQSVQVVYHLAWSTIPATANIDPAADIAVNLTGSIALLEAARKRAGIKLIFASSGGTVYGSPKVFPTPEDHPTLPLSAFGLCKLAAEQYILNYRDVFGLDGLSLRFSNCYGAAQRSERGLGAVALFARAALNNEAITVFGSRATVRDYLHVDDAVAALEAAGSVRDVRGPLNIGTGRGHSLSDVMRAVEAAIGRRVAVQYAPARPLDVATSVLDITKAKRELGWEPLIDLEQGVRMVVADLREEFDRKCGSPSSYTATIPPISTARKRTRAASPAA